MEEGHGGGAWSELGDERERVDGRRKGIGHGALLAAQRGETGERGSDRLGLEQWAAGDGPRRSAQWRGKKARALERD